MNTPTFKIGNHLKEHRERFNHILDRGLEAGLEDVSPELKEALCTAGAGIMAYGLTAEATEAMHEKGLPVHSVPEEIEQRITKSLNDLDDQMTLEISRIGSV